MNFSLPTPVQYYIQDDISKDRQLCMAIMNKYDLLMFLEKLHFNITILWHEREIKIVEKLKLFILKKATKYNLTAEIVNIDAKIYDFNWLYNMILSIYAKKKLYKSEMKYAKM